MDQPLTSSSDELHDLAYGQPLLVDAGAGRSTGARLLKHIGAGGMATVFLAEVEHAAAPPLADGTPRRIALKFAQPSVLLAFERQRLDPLLSFRKEVEALKAITALNPPTEFVVGYYGSGSADVRRPDGDVLRVPWLAIEYVDGTHAGATLKHRVETAKEGVDPLRALRLIRGMLRGAADVHRAGVIHRDLKPDNVFVAGPIDEEIPKLADLGIARVDGPGIGTLGAISEYYAAPEAWLSLLRAERNPLVGPWTDVFSLAAIVWYVVAGEDWYHGEAFRRGERRRLFAAGQRLHRGFAAQPATLGAIDAVLADAASLRVPDVAWRAAGAEAYRAFALQRFGARAFSGTERIATVDGFASRLLPLLEEAASRWSASAGSNNVAVTAFRQTRLVGPSAPALTAVAEIAETRLRRPSGTAVRLDDPAGAALTPGGLVFLPTGPYLARYGERLFYVQDDHPQKVAVPAAERELVARSRWMARGPGGGFAVVSEDAILVIRAGEFSRMRLPVRRDGGEVGAIQAVIGNGRCFGIVTAETDDSDGGPELWRASDANQWSGPTVLPLRGSVRALADGPYGFLVVGASENGKRGRALFLSMDDRITMFTTGVNDGGPLDVAVATGDRDAWAAGRGRVARFDAASVSAESLEVSDEAAVALALDPAGRPWLVTERCILRRHADGPSPVWKTYHRRDPALPQFVGIGFTGEGARVLDARDGVVLVAPFDVGSWRGAPTGDR
jgi:hypothetical protein